MVHLTPLKSVAFCPNPKALCAISKGSETLLQQNLPVLNWITQTDQCSGCKKVPWMLLMLHDVNIYH